MSTMKPIQATPTLSGKDAEAVIRRRLTPCLQSKHLQGIKCRPVSLLI